MYVWIHPVSISVCTPKPPHAHTQLHPASTEKTKLLYLPPPPLYENQTLFSLSLSLSLSLISY